MEVVMVSFVKEIPPYQVVEFLEKANGISPGVICGCVKMKGEPDRNLYALRSNHAVGFYEMGRLTHKLLNEYSFLKKKKVGNRKKDIAG